MNNVISISCVSKYGLFKLKRLSSLYDKIYFVGRYVVTKDSYIYEGTSNK